MADMLVIGSVLSSLKTATDIAKFIKESNVSLEQADHKLKLAELISALADAKIEIAEIQELILEKDEELKSLQNQLDVSKNIIWQEPYYFIEDDQGRHGPYCQPCYDSERKLIRLQGSGGKIGLWICLSCKNKVHDHSFKPEKLIVTGRSRR
jgi:hypothetical protein